jgi:hypothetical protein
MTTDNLFGLKVKREGNACRHCGYPVAVISAPTSEHCADLKCCACGAVWGALNERTASFIRSVANKFGAPTSPIILRRTAA